MLKCVVDETNAVMDLYFTLLPINVAGLLGLENVEAGSRWIFRGRGWQD